MFPDGFATTRLILRPIRSSDSQAIFDSYGQDAEVTRYLSWRPHASIKDTHAFVAACLGSKTSRTYVLEQKATAGVIGGFDLRRTGAVRLEFGYVLARAFWGQGLMTEALAEVADTALGLPSIWRIGAVADVENAASMCVMEKVGLRREGVLRRWLVHPNIGDAPRDCVSFARTR